MATGGVLIGGGIAPKIIDKLKGPLFMETFTAKGRLRSLMEAMPVQVILNDLTALRGGGTLRGAAPGGQGLKYARCPCPARNNMGKYTMNAWGLA